MLCLSVSASLCVSVFLSAHLSLSKVSAAGILCCHLSSTLAQSFSSSWGGSPGLCFSCLCLCPPSPQSLCLPARLSLPLSGFMAGQESPPHTPPPLGLVHTRAQVESTGAGVCVWGGHWMLSAFPPAVTLGPRATGEESHPPITISPGGTPPGLSKLLLPVLLCCDRVGVISIRVASFLRQESLLSQTDN